MEVVDLVRILDLINGLVRILVVHRGGLKGLAI